MGFSAKKVQYFWKWDFVSIFVEILWKNDLDDDDAPETKMDELENNYREKFANPYVAAERGYVDDVILPHETRDRLISGLGLLSTKVDSNPKKKHGNIPL